MLKIATDDPDRDDLAISLDDLVADGARRMLLAGLEAEVADYVDRHVGQVDEEGRRLVVRNGRAGERTLLTGAGALRIQAPRVNDRRDGRRFSSSILSAYARRSPKVGDVLPVLYLRGLSTGDFAPALEEFFGSDAGLSASTITRLLETWTDEYAAFEGRDLSGDDYVYVWADGVHFRIRLEEDRLCCLVDADVTAIRAHPGSDGENVLSAVGPTSALLDFAAEADVLVAAVPLTPSTSASIDRSILHAMKYSAILVNVSRGPVVDEAALFRVLESNATAGAALDVWYRYPDGDAPVMPSSPLSGSYKTS